MAWHGWGPPHGSPGLAWLVPPAKFANILMKLFNGTAWFQTLWNCWLWGPSHHPSDYQTTTLAMTTIKQRTIINSNGW